MDNPETRVTIGRKHRTKTKQQKRNTEN